MKCRLFEGKRNWCLVLQAAIITFALTVKWQSPLRLRYFSGIKEYLVAELKNLLLEYEYSFLSILIFIIAYIFLMYVDKEMKCEDKKCGYLQAMFFSFCYFVGTSYHQVGDWSYCFGSITNFIKFVVALVGMAILIQRVIGLLLQYYEKISRSDWQCKISKWLFGEKCFWKLFVVFLLVWFPAILISYPGNLCYDAIGQIDQVLGNATYSSHHPLLSTLIMGGCVKLGYVLLGSYEIGLFSYVIFQAALLSSALAGSLWWLSKKSFVGKKVSHGLLCIILGIYIFSPMYSNMVSTVVKDTVYVAVFIWYMILLAELCLNSQRRNQACFWILFVAVQIMVSLLRNNGFYVIFLTGILLCLLWWKQSDIKQRLQNVCYLFIVPVVASKLLGLLLLISLSAQEGKAAEIFSLPFQQTARYLQLYRQEVTSEEAHAIEQVLGDLDAVAASYNPKLADPVKAFFYSHEEVTTSELIDYFMVWAKDFFKHPGVYFEAFFHHVYGWFSPQVGNTIRYEAEYDVIPRDGLFEKADGIMTFVYRLADCITPLSVLQNVGVYTWAIFVLLSYSMRKNKRASVLLIPLLLSLLICMASPCFFLHPRYAYPYMCTIPFLYGLAERSRE